MRGTLVAREPVAFAKGAFAARRRAVLAPIPDLQHGELLAAAGAESVIPGSLDFCRLKRSQAFPRPFLREPVENTSIVAASEWIHLSPAYGLECSSPWLLPDNPTVSPVDAIGPAGWHAAALDPL
jgi:hypothetical protein